MIDQFQNIADFCKLEIPTKHHRKIGVIGAGGIVSAAHLPAYDLAGLKIAGITDLNLEKAGELAATHKIERVYDTVDQLLDDPTIEVVDIAVPAAAQPEILLRAVKAGKHVLAQKPLATSVAEAQNLLDEVSKTDRVVAVNQQLRFDEGMAAAYKMVRDGWIGEVSNFSITVNLDTPWELWDWAQQMEKLEIMVHSIHYHDVVRWFMGEPARVFALAGRTAGQSPIGETRTISSYAFDSGATALVHANHVNRGGDNLAEFRIDGDQGSIKGTLGLLYDYPVGRVDTLEVMSKSKPTDGWVPYPVTTRWIPHAFIGTMGSLLQAIDEGSTPRSSLSDNIKTIELIHALYESISSGKAVEL